MTAPAIAIPVGEHTAEAPCLVWQVTDRGRPLGTVVVDRLIAGRACGGLRIAPAVTHAELRELAAVMTLKFGFFGIACGGAKAGLVVPDDATPDERARRARAFGAAAGPLLRAGTYVPGTDLGCAERDVWDVSVGAGLREGRPPATAVETSATAHFSGRSAAIAAIAALGGRVAGATCAILGYGRVGAALAARFAAAGGRVIAVSTACGAVADRCGLDLAQLERARAAHGDEAPLHYVGGRVDPRDLVELGADVLAPCATSRMIDDQTWRRVRCRIIAPGANAALSPEAEVGLARAGVTVLPDFVANAGGILVSHFWPLPLSEGVVTALLERRFRAVVEALLIRATRTGRPVAEVARTLAAGTIARLVRDPRSATRHEAVIRVLARTRLRRIMPDALLTPLVAAIARRLGPAA
jgi:glutamate dehydrogenase (NAD(P)+)